MLTLRKKLIVNCLYMYVSTVYVHTVTLLYMYILK